MQTGMETCMHFHLLFLLEPFDHYLFEYEAVEVEEICLEKM